MVKKKYKKKFLLIGTAIFFVVILGIIGYFYYFETNKDVRLAPASCPPGWSGATPPKPYHTATVTYDSITTVGLDSQGNWCRPGGDGCWNFDLFPVKDDWCEAAPCNYYGENAAIQQCYNDIEPLKPPTPACGSKCNAIGPTKALISGQQIVTTGEFEARTGDSITCNCHSQWRATCYWRYGCSLPILAQQAEAIDTGSIGSTGTVSTGTAGSSATQAYSR
jgi:hypothetical protein